MQQTEPSPIPRSSEAFVAFEPITLIDGKNRRFLVFLAPDTRPQVTGGYLEANVIIGKQPGTRFITSRGQTVVAWRTTLEEYVMLMRRAATVIPPKDMAFMIHWGDVFPGAVVAEAGIGSGALTLGLLRAVGEQGRVIAFELREDHANRARKNVAAWPGSLIDRLEVRMGDVQQELANLPNVDRLMLDLPEPHLVLPAAAQALKPGGIIVTYVPTIRQIDNFVLAVLNHPDFAEPEVVEVMVRPWVADRQRLRPELRIAGHTGFLARARRRGGGIIPGSEAARARGEAVKEEQPNSEQEASAPDEPETAGEMAYGEGED